MYFVHPVKFLQPFWCYLWGRKTQWSVSHDMYCCLLWKSRCKERVFCTLRSTRASITLLYFELFIPHSAEKTSKKKTKNIGNTIAEKLEVIWEVHKNERIIWISHLPNICQSGTTWDDLSIHAMLLDLQKFWNGLTHLAVLTFPVRAATKQSALPCWKKNALCVVPSRCCSVTCCPFLVIRKLLRSSISIRTDRHRLCPSLLPSNTKTLPL